jgi:hypothetical protein
MLLNPQIVSTNKKWALGPVLFFNFAILANSRFSAKTTAYKWGAVTVRQVILRHWMAMAQDLFSSFTDRPSK